MDNPVYNKFLSEVCAEADRAITNHGVFNSLHEGYAILLEEVDEFWDIVRQKRSQRNPEELRTELVQIAAMAMKVYFSMDLDPNSFHGVIPPVVVEQLPLGQAPMVL